MFSFVCAPICASIRVVQDAASKKKVISFKKKIFNRHTYETETPQRAIK